jgi:hypothetical protein
MRVVSRESLRIEYILYQYKKSCHLRRVALMKQILIGTILMHARGEETLLLFSCVLQRINKRHTEIGIRDKKNIPNTVSV